MATTEKKSLHLDTCRAVSLFGGLMFLTVGAAPLEPVALRPPIPGSAASSVIFELRTIDPELTSHSPLTMESEKPDLALIDKSGESLCVIVLNGADYQPGFALFVTDFDPEGKGSSVLTEPSNSWVATRRYRQEEAGRSTS